MKSELSAYPSLYSRLMYLMKKTLVVILTLCALAVPQTGRAIDLGGGLVGRTAVKAGYSAATETTLAEIIGEVIKTALSFVGVIFLVLMVYAGFLWMNARGDESKIEKSQDIIRAAIIGMIITVGAYSITAFVVPRIVSRTSGPSGAASGGDLSSACGRQFAACVEDRCDINVDDDERAACAERECAPALRECQ